MFSETLMVFREKHLYFQRTSKSLFAENKPLANFETVSIFPFINRKKKEVKDTVFKETENSKFKLESWLVKPFYSTKEARRERV